MMTKTIKIQAIEINFKIYLLTQNTIKQCIKKNIQKKTFFSCIKQKSTYLCNPIQQQKILVFAEQINVGELRSSLRE